ncbi:MAG: NUDIX hydrolase [Candidatus Neomarinimicrobiota bacterium]
MMESQNFEETKLDSRKVFDGRLLKVYRDTVRLPGGQTSNREWIKHPGAAVVIPYLGSGRILLVRQFRYPVGQVMTELPAGKIDPGESPSATIRREMAEETGFVPQKLNEIGLIHTCVSYSDERLYLFWATELEKCSATPDEDELIETVSLDIADALDLVYQGKITDAKTVIGLFWAEKIIRHGLLNLCADRR